jgi:uncharacterized protein (TIGR03437 family)
VFTAVCTRQADAGVICGLLTYYPRPQVCEGLFLQMQQRGNVSLVIAATASGVSRWLNDALQLAAVNALDGSINDAAHPVRIGGYLSLFATGAGQTNPAGTDGVLATGPVLPQPVLPASVTVGGLPAVVQYAGAAPREVAGLMQINVQIPAGVQPGGYVPVAVSIGNTSTVAGAVWIAVVEN